MYGGFIHRGFLLPATITGTPEQTVDRSEGDINCSSVRNVWQQEHLNNAAHEALARDAQVFLRQSLSTPCMNVLTGARGAWIEDSQGRRYLDLHGNSAHQVGYGHPRVLEAVRMQMETLPFCPRRYANRTATELAERLAELAPGTLSKCLFAPGGSLAIGIALKVARAATGRYKTVSFHGSFHGASLDAASVAGEELFHARMGPMMPGALHVRGPCPTGQPCGYGSPSEEAENACTGACAAEVEDILAREGDIAAVIAEPVRATTVGVPQRDYWRRVRAACERHGTLLIFDEIPTGLGRTGAMFACEHFGVMPDILVLGKGLGSGLIPIAATIVRPELDVAPELALGHYTHEKSPLGAAAALATLRVIEEECLIERSRSAGAWMLGTLRDALGGCEGVADCRGLGMMIGIEHAATAQLTAEQVAEDVMYRSLSVGLSYKVGGGRVATLFPPLTVTDVEIEVATSGFLRACESVCSPMHTRLR